ncbi:MAG TPA: hypothetical protein VG206_25675 [Terriglobia bacterium]|nr:hypothetical protein [Terriglobia bacterium]
MLNNGLEFWFFKKAAPYVVFAQFRNLRQGTNAATPNPQAERLAQEGRPPIHSCGLLPFGEDTRLTESTRLEMRFEFFNVLNHTQFNPAGILTDINFGPVFGQEFEAFSPRLIQLAAKFYF